MQSMTSLEVPVHDYHAKGAPIQKNALSTLYTAHNGLDKNEDSSLIRS